jgi:heptosyltransferase-2
VIAVEGNFDFAALRHLKKKLKENQYGLIIDAHNNLRTFYLRWFIGFRAKKHVFKKYTIRKFLLVKFKINLMKNLPPIAKRYVSIIKKLTDEDEKFVFEPVKPIPENSTKERINAILPEYGIDKKKGYVVIAPASKHFTKTYPAKQYAELINKLHYELPVVLVGKGNDSIAAEEIVELTKTKVHNLVDKLNIAELTELISQCSFFISGDTGPMHIAEAAGIPLVMLAGSSVSEFGFYPVNSNSVVQENNSLSCRPCSHIGRSSCPKRHFKCMIDISPDNIVAQINSLRAK